MPREKITPDRSSYAGRVAAKLRAEREKRWSSVQAFADHLRATQGVEVKPKTLYAYEVGKANGGADVPISLLPVFAKAFGFKSPGGWLPTIDPEQDE